MAVVWHHSGFKHNHTLPKKLALVMFRPNRLEANLERRWQSHTKRKFLMRVRVVAKSFMRWAQATSPRSRHAFHKLENDFLSTSQPPLYTSITALCSWLPCSTTLLIKRLPYGTKRRLDDIAGIKSKTRYEFSAWLAQTAHFSASRKRKYIFKQTHPSCSNYPFNCKRKMALNAAISDPIPAR